MVEPSFEHEASVISCQLRKMKEPTRVDKDHRQHNMTRAMGGEAAKRFTTDRCKDHRAHFTQVQRFRSSLCFPGSGGKTLSSDQESQEARSNIDMTLARRIDRSNAEVQVKMNRIQLQQRKTTLFIPTCVFFLTSEAENSFSGKSMQS